MEYKLTDEQNEIVDAIINIHKHDIVSVSATSGSSKTSTMLFALNSPEMKFKKGLMLAYNKKIATENAGKVPNWVDSMTIHSLAYKHVVSPLRLKVNGSVSLSHIKGLKSKVEKYTALKLLSMFCASRFTNLSDFIKQDSITYPNKSKFSKAIKTLIHDMHSGMIPITFDVYIKLFHIFLEHGDIVIDDYDILMIDEFGDSTGTIVEIFKLIKAKKKVASGDCLTGEMSVLTSKGWRTMVEIIQKLNRDENVKVLSYDSKHDKFEFKKALNPIMVKSNRIYTVVTTEGKLRGTADHPVLTNKGYVNLGELKEKDIVLCWDKYNRHPINSFVLETSSTNGSFDVYDFEVEDNHNFITSGGSVVHNCHQNIFTFNHTINGLNIIEDELNASPFTLGRSFRCSSEIARAVSAYCINTFSPNMKFIGSKVSDTIQTAAFITRGNAALLREVWECIIHDRSFSLTRSPSAIMSDIMFVKVGAEKMYNEAKIAELKGEKYDIPNEKAEFINEYRLMREAEYPKTFTSWIIQKEKKGEYVNQSLMMAASTAVQFSTEKLILINEAMSDKARYNPKYILTTSFSFKGGESDIVYIDDSLNKAVEKSLGENRDDTEHRLYYVACTRAKHTVVNATALDEKLEEHKNHPVEPLGQTIRGSQLTYTDFIDMVNTHCQKDLK